MANESQRTKEGPTVRIHNEVYPFIYPSKFRGSLQDKVAVITGAAGAIGQGHAESFAVAGCRLFLVYNRTPPPDTLEARCRQLGAANVHFVQCNVSELASCEKLVHHILEATIDDSHASGRVDILVNNAGANMLAPMYEQDPRDFLYDMAVNFNGPYCLMRLLMPTFRAQRSGCVINIASRAGTVILPWSTSYCASKAALINLTGCIQMEADAEGFSDIHLYALHPGGVRSTMVTKKYSDESVSALPVGTSQYRGLLDFYNDSVYLGGMVSVALATGVAKHALRGRYFDVGHDLEDVLAHAAEIRASPELYSLHTSFVGGLSNATMGPRPNETPFDFPGF
ncbi:uncharacterized protein SPSK_07699 [Sporothrix schenckii 1099-18]|uniref:Uncharacterized protein n=2 Tax=Sporothrix schenckii TaxID=29908 RepID=U7PZE2_SPOS1|nr:uncharacterized protein SPSK_07699 [Sporothrix schenckii 1099-18]ERT00948.1 hypothetical protein HMPREF1624_02183 [Sporothrix schenckii ATCC 58251]KJR88062.1 hypothetical protein SPSK_07699 [Sporothrix schenckii 1099-18]